MCDTRDIEDYNGKELVWLTTIESMYDDGYLEMNHDAAVSRSLKTLLAHKILHETILKSLRINLQITEEALIECEDLSTRVLLQKDKELIETDISNFDDSLKVMNAKIDSCRDLF